MKKIYIIPTAIYVLGDDILFVAQPQTGSEGDAGKLTSKESNMLVWDDDFEEDDTWGYNGF